MTDNAPISKSVALPERQDSRLSEEENQSSGSGSGAGYSADYESSESSLSSKQKNELQQQEEKSNRGDKEKASVDTAGVKGKHKKKKSRDYTGSNQSVSSLDHTNEQLQALLPQWNGIRITHPMDPRIDLSTVGYTVPQAGQAVYSNTGAFPTSYTMAPHMQMAPHNISGNSNPIDHYLSLMEAVKPFFGAYTPVANAEPPTGEQQSPDTGSSEGFTAFFTTTNSNTGTTNTSSDSNSDPNAIQNRQVALQKSNDDDTSVSSMVALARVKRKHKKKKDGTSPSSSSGSETRRDENDSAEQQPYLGETNETNPQQPQPPRRHDSSSSSSLSEEQDHQFPIPPPRQPLENDIRADMNNVLLPLVSESSDARQSNGFSSQSNATASGSGSNENSGVSNKGSSGSGSGSNNGGSSGSGNEEKGDLGGNSNSDENNNKVIEPVAAAADGGNEPMVGLEQETNDDGSTREDRLMDKKRKRLDMRREYELDMNFSSSDDQQESLFEPGKPVTLDTALSFSRMARIVAQASPPFLVVHANAAFTRLTGVDSHEVNGRSISNLFTIPSSKDNGGGPQSHQAAAAAGRARAQEETSVERLVMANGFDDYHIIQVAAKLEDVDDRNCDSVQCRMSISPIVAKSMPPTEASGVVTDTNHQGSHHHKKRKHHHHQEVTHKHQKPPAATNPMMNRGAQMNIITHYMIQLEPDDVNQSALTSDGAALMCKLEQAQQHDQEMLDNEADLEETSHSTDPKEPVEAVG